MPLGCWDERDNSSSRADSSVDAATITTLALASYDFRVPLSRNATPRAFPVFRSTSTSCAIELVRIVRCPVTMAGYIKPVGESNAAWMAHTPGRRTQGAPPAHVLRFGLGSKPTVVVPGRHAVTGGPLL